MALTEKLSAIGSAIREKTGKTEMLTLDAMPGEIRSIEGGGGSSADVRYVTFMSYDGTEEYIRLPVAVGYDCPEPKIETPTRESTAQYNYTFAGWATTVNGALDSNALKAVTEDRTVYANFAAILIYYTVNYYDEDGTTLLKTAQFPYGADASYTPEKDGYKFTGWSQDVTNVTGNMDVTASWEVDDGYIHDSWETVVERAKAGTAANYYKVGNKIALPLTYADGTEETVDMYLAAFDKGMTIDGNSAKVAFVCANALQKLYMFHDSAKQGTTSLTSEQYLNLKYVKHLHDDILPAMPTVLQNNVLNRQLMPNFTSYPWSGKLWALSESDLNTNGLSTGAYWLSYNSVLPDATSRVMYQKGGTSPVDWWLAEYRVNNSWYKAKYVNTTGSADNYADDTVQKYQTKGVVFGFLL